MIRLERGIKPDFRITNLDRRKYPRFSNALPVEYWQLGNPEIRLGFTTNISKGGLMTSLTEQMEVRKKLRLKIFFISGRDLRTLDVMEVTGKVVWSRPDMDQAGYNRIGMKFENIAPREAKSLGNFLSHFGIVDRATWS